MLTGIEEKEIIKVIKKEHQHIEKFQTTCLRAVLGPVTNPCA